MTTETSRSTSISTSQPIPFKDIKSQAEGINPSTELESAEINQSSAAEYQAQKLALELYSQEQFLDLQRSWGKEIKLQIWVVILFQIGFVLLVGFNVNGFTTNLSTLPYMYVLVILQTLANIVALGYVIVRFLFPSFNSPKK